MDFNQLITTRQSVRKYKAEEVSKSHIMQCVEAARLAPSACNAQPWHLVVVSDETLKNAVCNCAASMGMNKFCAQAAAIVAIVLERPNFTSKIGSIIKKKDYTLMDIGIAAEHFCLQATALGLGTCMVGWFDEKKVQQLLKIPKNKRIPLLVAIGQPDDMLRPKIRKTMEEMYSENSYK